METALNISKKYSSNCQRERDQEIHTALNFKEKGTGKYCTYSSKHKQETNQEIVSCKLTNIYTWSVYDNSYLYSHMQS